MNSRTVALINVEPSAQSALREAVTRALPEAKLIDDVGREQPDVVILGEADSAAIARYAHGEEGDAVQSAVVVISDSPSDMAETISRSEIATPIFARVLRSAIQQRDLLRENARLRGDLKTMARRISHDLRTPAGCIHTSSDLLDELMVGKSAAVSGIADVFRQSSAEISQIIDRASFVLRASAEPGTRGPVDMRAIVQGVLSKLEPQIQAAGAAITQPDVWPAIEGVAPWLQVIWLNLIQNALRHGGPSPQITIGCLPDADGAEFFVADRGPGVPAARESGVFAPFDRLHAIRSAGLGLSIVHRLVSLQGGRCAYAKGPEGGARFSFTLPAHG
jgi:signal transduction histidine kinase